MWFHFLCLVAVTASAEPLYRKIGDKAVLTPGSVVNPINNLVWNHGPYIAMVWHRNGGEPLSYRQFKDRGSLDIATGAMTITGLTRDDSGIYIPEINKKVYNQTQLLVISPVPKPTISVSCDPQRTNCIFTCHGSTTGAEPVTYWWAAGGKRWNSTKELKITKEDKEEWISCIVVNPVSSHSSETIFNPFLPRDNTWRLICLIPLFIMIVCIIVIIYSRHKYIKIMNNTGLKPQWQFERKKRVGWLNFRKTTDGPNGCSVTSDFIERWYQKKPHSKMPFTVITDTVENDYELDFNKMIQTDQKKGNKRKVRRVMLPPE